VGRLITDLAAAGNVYHYTSNQNNVNFFTDAGSPGSGNWTIVIDPGVTLGSTDKANPAATTGVFPGTLSIKNRGRIQGKGGVGGYGRANLAGKEILPLHRGSGGGGAGTAVGLGGASSGPTGGGPGENGTSEAGGAGSNSSTNDWLHDHFALHNVNYPGYLDGGKALDLGMDVTIHNQIGEIWGGGGGGAPGNLAEGAAGGGPGEDGLYSVGTDPDWAGDAGKAIELNGNSITWGGGSGDPNVKGPVS
jgi:hypothetical protein